eukprot:s4092_g4.t1
MKLSSTEAKGCVDVTAGAACVDRRKNCILLVRQSRSWGALRCGYHGRIWSFRLHHPGPVSVCCRAQLQGTLILGGWSLGALPARQVAHCLEMMEFQVYTLFALDERTCRVAEPIQRLAARRALAGEALGPRFRSAAISIHFTCPRFREVCMEGQDFTRRAANDGRVSSTAALHSARSHFPFFSDARHFDIGVSHAWDIYLPKDRSESEESLRPRDGSPGRWPWDLFLECWHLYHPRPSRVATESAGTEAGTGCRRMLLTSG